ncbi:MAG: outer membrane protein assembly factor BamE domain-containing protein [Acidiferrobacterales bacterium]
MARAQTMRLPTNQAARCGGFVLRKRTAAATVLACVLGAVTPMRAWAQTGDASSLKAQVQNLTRRVDELEAEVAALQHVQAAQPVAAGRPAVTVNQNFGPEANLRHAWRQLKRGMTAAEVTKILGRPSTQFRTSNITVWYYHYAGVGSGSVTISQDGKLGDWQPPSHGL